MMEVESLKSSLPCSSVMTLFWTQSTTKDVLPFDRRPVAGNHQLTLLVLETFIAYGTSGNLLSYLTGQLGQHTATSNLNAWSGVTALSLILGAFLAGSFMGRFGAIIIADVLYILGLVFLSVSALLTSFGNTECEKASNNATCSPSQPLIMFFFSLYLVALAQGDHQPSIQAFGADQFDDENEKKVSRQGIACT